MVKKTLGYVELEWTCPNCGTRNPGPQKSCSSCGTAQPKRVEFHQSAQEELLTDQTEIARAKAGPDVHCAFCGARNPTGADRCSQCGADLGSAQTRQSGTVLGAHRPNAADPIACPKCGTLNEANATRCTQCNASLPRTPRDKRRPPIKRTTRPKPSKRSTKLKSMGKLGIVGIIIGLVLISALICSIVLLVTRCMSSEEMTAQVQAVEWTRSIEIQALTSVTREGWREEIPRDARLGRCTQKLYRTQDSPAPNATEVCGTPYTVDTGTGHGQVVQDCEYKVYAEWCQYQAQEWRPADKAEASGNDLNVYWPATNLGPAQREGDRDASYRVILSADGKTYTYHTQDVDRFQQCAIGSRWVIRVNGLGGVGLVRPAS